MIFLIGCVPVFFEPIILDFGCASVSVSSIYRSFPSELFIVALIFSIEFSFVSSEVIIRGLITAFLSAEILLAFLSIRSFVQPPGFRFTIYIMRLVDVAPALPSLRCA